MTTTRPPERGAITDITTVLSARGDPAPAVKVLVATAISQGDGPWDQFGCIAGELLWIPSRCSERDCTCAVLFMGSTSNGCTTTAEVVQARGPRSRLARALAASMCSHCHPGGRALAEAERLLRTADRFPLGGVVERDGRGGVRLRQVVLR